MAMTIKQNNIKGIIINNTEIKLNQLEDDAGVFIKDVCFLTETLQTLNNFKRFRGLTPNYEKTTAMQELNVQKKMRRKAQQ